jgi:hypothetical protein
MTDVLDIPIIEMPIIELPPEDTRTPTVRILDYMIDLFRDRRKWGRFAYARDKNGEEVKWNSEQAVRWCMLGGHRLAYAHVYGVSYPLDDSDATRYLMDAVYRATKRYGSIPGFNDSAIGHASMMAVLYSARDAAIKDSA